MVIPECFAGKNVFITGGTGFLGKALMEKFLRSCPDLENIYVLIRKKKGLSAQERLNNITDNLLFEPLKRSNPSALSKLVAIEGDVSKLRLGISEADRQLLIERVNFIYHNAASVRFDDHLRDSIFVNVRSTKEIIELAYELKNLSTFAYVSTTYCNVDKSLVEEKVYPAHGDWKEAIRLAEEFDPTLLEIMTMKYIEPMPNTYIYAKGLSENVVVDMCKGKIPAIIFRPSIVIPVYSDPVPGWTDNFNGPVGLFIACGKGVLRITYGQPDTIMDLIPVDTTIRILIVATAENCNTKNIDEVKVYNCSKHKKVPITMSTLAEMGHKLVDDVPFKEVLWYPRFSLTSCWYNYYIQVLLFHMIPAFFLDVGLRLAGKKPMLFKIQRKIYTANTVLYPFLQNTWDFVNYNIYHLFENFPPEDLEDFDGIKHFDIAEEQIYPYFRQCTTGAALCLFNEKFDKEVNRKLMRRRWMVDVALRSILIIYAFWYFFIRINIFKLYFNFSADA